MARVGGASLELCVDLDPDMGCKRVGVRLLKPSHPLSEFLSTDRRMCRPAIGRSFSLSVSKVRPLKSPRNATLSGFGARMGAFGGLASMRGSACSAWLSTRCSAVWVCRYQVAEDHGVPQRVV